MACARMASASASQGGRGSTAPPSPATLDASSTAPALTESVTAARVGGASTVPSTTVLLPALGKGSVSEIHWTGGGASVRPDGEVQAILLLRTALSPKSLFVGTVKTTIKVGAIKTDVSYNPPLRWACRLRRPRVLLERGPWRQPVLLHRSQPGLCLAEGLRCCLSLCLLL